MAEPFLECPSHWRKGTLEPGSKGGLIVAADTGTTPKTEVERYWDGDIPWLTPKEISRRRGGIFVSTTERTVTREGLVESSLKLHPAGTVMLTKRAPVGMVAVNTAPMTVNQGFLAFTCGPHLRSTYLAYWLIANRPYLEQVANGSTYPELYVADLFEFEISVPPLEYQNQVIQVIKALQFTAMLTLPMEQALGDTTQINKIHAYRDRMEDLVQKILILLLSGKLDVRHVGSKIGGILNEKNS